MEKEVLSFQIATKRGEKITFHLAMISKAEDARYSERFATLVDCSPEERAEREYDIYVDALAGWSDRMPTQPKEVKVPAGNEGETKTEIQEVPIGTGSIPAAVKAWFGDRSRSKEWIAESAVAAFRTEHFPLVVSRKHSA